MVKKQPISKIAASKHAQGAQKRLQGQPRKSYPNGVVSKEKCAEIEAILRSETRSCVRKRLIAVHTIYAGGTDAAAARHAEASISGVSHWLRQAQAEGITSLLRSRPGRKPSCRFSEKRAARLREAITAALDNVTDPAARNRLQAVRAVLAGETRTSVARDSGVTTQALIVWMQKVYRGGIEALLPADRAPIAQADPATLRIRASHERDSRMVVRLSGIALLAEGWSCQQVADRLGVTFVTVHDWLNRFRASGIDGLRDRPAPPRRANRRRVRLASLDAARRHPVQLSD